MTPPGSNSTSRQRSKLTRNLTARPAASPSHGCESLTLRDELCRQLHLWPSEVQLGKPEDRAVISSKLRRALRHQRRLIHTNNWSYDVSVHAQLLALYKTVQSINHVDVAYQVPSSSPVQIFPARNSVRPSGSHAEVSTSPGTLPALTDNASSDAVSEI